MPTKPDVVTGTRPLIEISNLDVHFALRGGSLSRLFGRDTGTVRAVDNVDLTLYDGEVLGLVGESGSGKTTLGRTLLGLVRPTAGEILFHRSDSTTVDVATASNKRLRSLRTELQMVFQDPHAALNPSMDLETAVGHPLKIHGIAQGADLRVRVAAALERVGLAPAERYLSKYPADLSGGQKQRAVLARAIILEPELLVADEPVSMLDMSVRAKIIQLMQDLKVDLGLTYIYITHDLASAKYFCDRIAIMYLGRIVEIGPTAEIFAHPKHPYTQALLKAIPEPDPRRMVPRDLPRGEIPDAAEPPRGCSFHPRCLQATAACGWETRDLKTALEEHWTRNDPAVFERETAMLGRLKDLNRPRETVTLGTAANAGEVRAVLDKVKAETPGDPLWLGIDEIRTTSSGVEVRFHPGTDPGLRRSGGVEVACVLYPEGS